MTSPPVALTVTVILAILSTPISTGAQTARSSTVGTPALVRDAPPRRGYSGLEPGAEDLSAMLRGLARYQGTTDELVAPQPCIPSVVLAPERVPVPSRYTAPPAAFTV